MENAGTNQQPVRHHPDVHRIYLLTTRTHQGQTILGNPRCANTVLAGLKWLDQQERIDLMAAVVMPDHAQFVARLNLGTVAMLMQSFKGYTGWQINHILNREGTVWQSGYHERALGVQERLQSLIDACLDVPARAGFVEDIRDYPWWYCCFEPA